MGSLQLLCVAVCCFLIPVLAAEEQESKDIYTQAATCPYRFNMGCFLDVVEKSCTGLQSLEACATKGQCKNVEELQRLVGALDPKNFEALNKCCCTKAFPEGYEDCKTPNPVCKKAIAEHVDKDLQKHLPLLQKCLNKPKKSTCKEALASAKWVTEALQKARGEMWSAEGCKLLAPPEPVSACGWDVKPTPRAIERPDLYCDAIIWQFKEMGASDPFMAKCKDAPKMPENAGGSPQGEEGEREEGEGEEQGEEEGEAGPEGNEKDMENEEGAQVEEKGDDLYSKASKCPHRSHMGCLLDVVEKSCEATRELLLCANGTACEKTEIKVFNAAMKSKSSTSLTRCCCSGRAYEKCKKPNSLCMDGLIGEQPENLELFLKQARAYQKKANKANAEKALEGIKQIRDSLQKARGRMWKVEGCQMLAPMEPLIECGWKTNVLRPIERDDLSCDSLMWQYKELAMYDETMSKCPGAPKVNPDDLPQEEEEEEVEVTSVRDEL